MADPSIDIVTFTVTRESVTQDDDGGVDISYTAAARGALPTSILGFPLVDQKRSGVLLGATEQIEYGVRGDKRKWTIITSINPRIDTRDRVTWTDDVDTIVADAITRSVRPVPGEDYWIFTAEDVTTGP